MKQTVKNAQAADLLEVLSQASRQPKMPLKFCIARNIRLLQEPVSEYVEQKEILFKKAVKMDDEGNGVVKEEHKEAAEKMGGRVPYGMFEYNSPEQEEDFFKGLIELNNKEIEIDFSTESASRVIKVSGEDGKYSDTTIQQVLEDPNNNITPAMITLFMGYFLED